MSITRHNPQEPLPTTGHSVILAGGTVTLSRYPDMTATFICDTPEEAEMLRNTLALQREQVELLRRVHTQQIQWLIDNL